MSGTNSCLSKPLNLLFKQVGYLMCVTHQIACSACCQNEPPGGRFRCRSAASKSGRPPQNPPTPIKSPGQDHRRIWPVPGYSGPVDCRTFEPNPRPPFFRASRPQEYPILGIGILAIGSLREQKPQVAETKKKKTIFQLNCTSAVADGWISFRRVLCR